MKHISTLSYTLTERKYQEEHRGAQTGGMDMLKDHGGENASKAKREMERWQKGLYNTQLQSQSLICITEKKSRSRLVSRGGRRQTGCRDSGAQF